MRTQAILSCVVPLSMVFDTTFLAAQTPVKLDESVIAENRELDRLLIEAHDQKNIEKVLAVFSQAADTFFIAPNGELNQGRDAIRKSYLDFFAGLDSLHGEIQDVSYIPAGEGVIAVGTVIFYRHPKKAPADQRTVIWTDYRRRENGRWVYVFRHAHWPLASNPQLNPAPPRK